MKESVEELQKEVEYLREKIKEKEEKKILGRKRSFWYGVTTTIFVIINIYLIILVLIMVPIENIIMTELILILTYLIVMIIIADHFDIEPCIYIEY